jgi:Family of unknown function (DUF6353)
MRNLMTRNIKQFEKLIADNSPTILTAIGVMGTITTAVLTAKASFKAADILVMTNNVRDLHEKKKPVLTVRQKLELIWVYYIPPVLTGTLTIVCIIGSNRIGNRRAAAIAAAYSLSDKAFTEYKEKIVEKLGENKERAARDELAQDQVNKNSVTGKEVIMTGNGDVLCYEAYTGRYFQSNVESLKKAQNDINFEIINDGYSSLTDFYNIVGLPSTSASDEVGWRNDTMLDIRFSTTLSEDGRPCISIDYRVEPIRNYYRIS